MIRLYFVPKIGTGTESDPFRPAFVDGIAGNFCEYGKEPWFLVQLDVTPEQHTAIIGNSGVTSVPQNLDADIGGNLAAVQTALESMNIPADWITSGMSYRFVLRYVLRLFVFMQWVKGLAPLATKFFDSGLTLSSTVSNLPVEVRQRMNTAATSHGIDTSSITLATTLQAALRTILLQINLRMQLGVEPL